MAEVPGGAVVLVPGDPRTIDIGGATVIVLADEHVTERAFSLIETVDADAGFGPPLHVHRDATESFYVIEGEYLMHLDGRDFRCVAGSFIHVPVGMPHTFQASLAGSRKLNLYAPAAMVGYFDELATAIRDGVDEAGLDEIAGRYAMDVLGPAPDGYLHAKDD